MNNDFYSEQLEAKKSGSSETAKKILIGVLTALVAAFLFLIIIFPLSLLLVGLVFYGGYYLMTGIDTEYEYILTNGDLDIDKITGKRKRKRLLSTKIGHFTAFGKLGYIPSFLIKAGDVIEVAEKSRSSVKFKRLPGEDAVMVTLPQWLEREKNTLKGTVTKLPAREDIDMPIEEHLIVELYSK